MSETTAEPRHDAEWNADELACGELVLELMLHIKTIEPGRVLKVTTDDPGAPQDIPAWCNLTDNVLLAQRRRIPAGLPPESQPLGAKLWRGVTPVKRGKPRALEISRNSISFKLRASAGRRKPALSTTPRPASIMGRATLLPGEIDP